MGKTKVKISCFNCKKLGVTCAAMWIPSNDCFAPKKQRVIKVKNTNETDTRIS